MKMKRFAKGIRNLTFGLALCLSAIGTFGQISQLSVSPPINNAVAPAVGPAGAITNPSGLLMSVSPGPVWCPSTGAIIPLHNTQFVGLAQGGGTATAQILYTIALRCSTEQIYLSNSGIQNQSDIPIATVQCGATLCNTITDLRVAGYFPNSADFIIPFGPGDCAWATSGTAGAAATLGLLQSGASGTMVLQQTATGAGASNNTLTCNIHLPQRTSAGKGYTLNDCTVYYGVQQTALTSMGAPTLSTITMPTAGTSETPSTVTPVSLGAVTVTPVVGSANLGLTTAGAFFSEKVALNASVAMNTDLQSIIFQQVFAQSAAAAQTVNTPGGVCHATGVLY
jgi:hypothetical protein